MAESGSTMTQGRRRKSPDKKKPSYFYSVVSVTLVLFLIGFFGLIILHGRQLVKVFKEHVNVLVEFKSTATHDQIDLFQRLLDNKPFVKEGSIIFTSKESAAEMLKEELGEDIESLGFQNPLYDMLSFNILEAFMQSDSLLVIKGQLKEHPAVSDVYYEQGLVDGLSRNIEKIGFVSLLVALLFLIIAVTLIHNTIRLALFANRFLIKNMQLVGASWGFISKPYLWKSIGNALISSLLAIAGLYLLLHFAYRDLPELAELANWKGFTILFASLLVLGILITFSSTFFVVNRYLKMRVDDLY